MEKKKLLLVAISVGIFLVIAIGAAILVFTPKNAAASGFVKNQGSEPTAAAPSPAGHDTQRQNPGTSQAAPLDAVELVRNPNEVPGLKPPPEGAIRPSNDFYVNGTAYSASGKNSETVINVPKPSTAAVPDTQAASRVASEPVQKVTQAAPRPAPAAPAAAPKSTSTAATRNKPVETKAHDDFWVQTGAFSPLARAEGVKESLATKGITSIIENRDIEGKTLFRVRVGPYTSQNEANYWLSLIKSIGGFEDSQVRQTTRL